MSETRYAPCEYIPDGMSGVVSIGAASSTRHKEADGVLTALTEHLTRHRLTDVMVRTTGGLGFYSAERLLKVTKPGMPSILYSGVTPETAGDIVQKHLVEGQPATGAALCQMPFQGAPVEGVPSIADIPFFALQHPAVSWRCGHIDPEGIGDAFRTGGYAALTAVLDRPPDDTLRSIESAQVAECGGQGTPIAERWKAAAAQPGEKYLVCNALEVEPGSVKDRWLLESDPHRLIEGMAIAARAVGARMGYVVLNPSYTLARHRLQIAVAQARRHQRLGPDIRGSGVDFDILIRVGPPGYATGEEAILLSFLEGKAEPQRISPPMRMAGLHGRPALVANVETFAHLTALPPGMNGASPPLTRLFTLEGTPHSGVAEVEIGTTLRTLVCGIGGTPEEQVKAVVIGGHLGGIVPADLLDMPLTEASYRWAGVWPGTGLISVMNRSASIAEWLRDHLRFASRESCGYCTPCREGMEQARRIAERLCDGTGQPQDLTLLEQLATYMTASSLCGYGHAVPGGITTAIRYFGQDLRERLTARR
jgi:NADH-quinone oxidoreductase subunit F